MALLIPLWRILELTLILVAAAGAGSLVLRSTGLERPLSRIFGALPLLSLSLGLGVFSYSILIIGLLGLLYPWTIWVLTITFGAISLLSGRDIFWLQGISLLRHIFTRFKNLSIPFKLVLLATASGALLNLVAAQAPPIRMDDLVYHFAGPERYLSSNKIVFIPDMYLTNLPFTMEMLWTAAIAMDSAELAQIMNWSIGLLGLLWIGLLGRHVGLNMKGISIAIALYYSISTIAYMSSSGNVELGSTVFILACIFGLLQWQHKRNYHWLVISAILIGFYAGTKLPHIATVCIFSMWVFVAQWLHDKSLRMACQATLLFGSLSCGVASIWYLKNWAMSGNPIYPAFPLELGGPPIRADLIRPGELSFSDLWIRNILSVESPFQRPFVQLYRLVLDPQRVRGHVSPLFVASLPLIFALSFKSRTAIRSILTLALILYLVWAPTTFFIRTGLPILALISIPVATITLELITKHYVFKWTITGLIGLWLATGLVNVGRITAPTFPVVAGFQSANEYLLTHDLADTRTNSYYDAIIFMNQNLTSETVILLWDSRGYYMERQYIFAYEFIQSMADPDLIYSSNQVINELQRFGITHVAMNYNQRRLRLREALEETGRLDCIYQGTELVVCALPNPTK